MGKIKFLPPGFFCWFCQDFFDSSTEYYKLERVDFGGSKGRFLTAQVQEVYEEFLEFYQQYNSIQYDVGDPEDDSFAEDYEKFKEKSKDNDQRLAAICVNAFDDCHTPESVYKLIMVLASLLDRSAIWEDLEPKFPQYIKMIEKDFDTVKVLLGKFVSISKLFPINLMHAAGRYRNFWTSKS